MLQQLHTGPKAEQEHMVLYFNAARLSQLLIRSVYKGPTVNKHISTADACVNILTLIETSPGYHKLKLDKKSYLTTFAGNSGLKKVY